MERAMNSRASCGPPYEVFLNFRGPDTRYQFTDFLYRGMVDAGILVFRDAESLRVGKRISGELQQAIEQSEIYIPIFSKKYASSRWCLRELATMVECTSKSNENKEILPIFLNVEPVDVKLKTNLFAQALSEHQEKFSAEVESWKKALIEVGEIKGWNWKKDESQADLIQSVIQTVLAKLNVRFKKDVTEDVIGVDDHVEAIMKMLDVDYDIVRFLGIHGMGGIGKTTFAKMIFNQLSSHFEGCNFLSDVRESSQRHGMVYLQKQLLSKFLESRYIDQIYDVDDGIKMIKRVLCNKKVLIVLDDVDEKEQLNSLAAKSNWFGFGNRIVITTRNRNVLMIEGEAIGDGPIQKSANVLTYDVQEMKFGHALKLFSRHAFRSDSPPDHYVSISNNVVCTLGKLPLALEVTGSFLSGKTEALWKDTLKKLQKAPPMEVQRTLMITYERLDDAQKEVFLDIACFFVNGDKTYPFYMWDDCGYCPNNAVEVLFLMSLIKIKNDNTFWMHDQVRDFGRKIICLENSKDPCMRSRVWNHEEALSILKQKEGSRKIEALSLGFLRYLGVTLRPDEFANLRNVRFFQGGGVFPVGDFNNLFSSLRWFSWHFCSSGSEPTNFLPTNLVVLDLSNSFISEEWIGWNQIRAASKLKVLDLSNCQNLIRTPDLSGLLSLERLILQGCHRLIEIDPSIGKLKLLTTLNLKGCQSLQVFPEEIGCLQALTELLMPDTLHELPETIGSLHSLLSFDVPNRRITKLPDWIGGFVKIRRLDISKCVKIKDLPNSVGKLESLVELNLSWTKIGHLPNSIGNLKQLKVLRMSHMIMITKLPSWIGLVEKLEELDACGCDNLTGEIPEEIGRLSYLRILNLSNTRISGLPTTVSRLSNLQTLNLELCPDLKHLPELPRSLTCLRWATNSTLRRRATRTLFDSDKDLLHEPKSLTVLPPGICAISLLETLTLSCENVQFLPQLPLSLRKLRLGQLATTQSLDFSNLKNLSTVEFHSCSVSEFSGIFDAGLEVLCMESCLFGNLDALFQSEMKKLRYLKMRSCEFLPKVLNLSQMKNLQQIYLFGCKLLVEICGLEELRSLWALSVRYCISLERMSDLSKLKKLRELTVGECPGLRCVGGLNYLESLQKLSIFNCGSLGSLDDISNLKLKFSYIS